MSKTSRTPKAVREPVQVYLTADDSAVLSRLVETSGLSKAEILRRGLRQFAAEHGGGSPMLQFIDSAQGDGWQPDVAANHDAVLADGYRPTVRKRR